MITTHTYGAFLGERSTPSLYFSCQRTASHDKNPPSLSSTAHFQAQLSNSHILSSPFFLHIFIISLSLCCSSYSLILFVHCSAATMILASSSSTSDDDPCPRSFASAAFFFPPDVAAGRDLTEPPGKGAGAGSKARMKGEMTSSGLGPIVVVGSRYAWGKKEGGKRRGEIRQGVSKGGSNKKTTKAGRDEVASPRRKEGALKRTSCPLQTLPSQPNPDVPARRKTDTRHTQCTPPSPARKTAWPAPHNPATFLVHTESHSPAFATAGSTGRTPLSDCC